MKKSVLTFALLASSLIMLSVMPLLNNNAAMAQEYEKYGDSYYSTYPTDDKKYECRTGPFEGFFVSSVEFCKFNKFDKDDNDDKKDVRDNRTGKQGPPGPPGPQGIQGPPGPAGGLPGPQGERGLTGATGLTGMKGPPGEDGTDGVNGTQGPRGFNGTDGVNGTQGPRGFNGTDGVNGTQGQQGIPGPNNVSTTKVYKQFGPNVTSIDTPNPNFGIFFVANSTATCLAGDTVLSGGYRLNSIPPFGGILHTVSVNTEPTSTEDGWTVQIATQNSRFTLQSIAECFDNP